MTANELADWIENGSPFGEYKTAKQASSMLRQQQAEIQALHNLVQQQKVDIKALMSSSKKLTILTKCFVEECNDEVIEKMLNQAWKKPKNARKK